MKSLVIFILIIFIFIISNSEAHASDINFKIYKNRLQKGDASQVDIILSGAEETLGTDLVIKYDPKMIKVMGVQEGSLYPAYQPPFAKRINTKLGEVRLSGSVNLGQPVKADGIFATILFRTLGKGQTKISFDYQPGVTDKTGVINFAGKNLLTIPPKELTMNIKDNNVFWSFLDGLSDWVKNTLQTIRGNKINYDS